MTILEQSKIKCVMTAKEKQFFTRKYIIIEIAKASFLFYN